MTDVDTTTTVHMTLQGKGGVGKSLVASLLHQYLVDSGEQVAGMDTDPVNATYSSIKDLNVGHMELLQDGKLIEGKFDELVEWILTEDGTTQKIIDTGASAFIAFASYLVENEVFEFLIERDVAVAVHVVIAGGQSYLDTLNGLDSLAGQLLPEAKIYVWINGGMAPVDDVESTQVYKRHEDRISGIVTLPHRSELWTTDMRNLLTNRGTFNAVQAAKEVPVMARRRLEIMQKEIWLELDVAL